MMQKIGSKKKTKKQNSSSYAGAYNTAQNSNQAAEIQFEYFLFAEV